MVPFPRNHYAFYKFLQYEIIFVTLPTKSKTQPQEPIRLRAWRGRVERDVR